MKTIKKVFISYAEADKSKVTTLQKVIDKTNILSAIVIANNRQALIQLSEKVKNGIKDCDYFVPILTPNSISAQWINQEIGYATALNREIFPIVEHSVIDVLKGFIHKQVDLSYSYEKNTRNVKSEAAKFARVSKLLVDDILLKNNVYPEKIEIDSLFPGKWQSQFDDVIEVKNGGKYYVDGKFYFDLKEVSIDVSKKRLEFKKVGDGRTAYNDLEIIEVGKRYKGIEEGSPIIYIRTS